MSKPKVYLAGPISGLSYGESTDWRRHAYNAFQAVGIDAFSPLRGKDYLWDRKNMPHTADMYVMSTQAGITARDRNDCMRADLVFVNLLGAKIVSIGTVMEIAWADANRIPIVLVMEPSGNLHDHPMVREVCAFRVADLADALEVAMVILRPNLGVGAVDVRTAVPA